MVDAFNNLHRPTRVAPEKNNTDDSFPSESDVFKVKYDSRASNPKTDLQWFASYWKPSSSGSCEISTRRINFDSENNDQSFVHF